VVFAFSALLQKGFPLIIEQKNRKCPVKTAIAMSQHFPH
jgi:hypothetical protein